MPPATPHPARSEEEFRLLRDLVHAHCGLWFRDDLRYLLERRLAQRLEVHGLETFAAYHRFLRFDPRGLSELDEATDLLTTNETYLHREPHQLRAFTAEVLPAMARARERERRVRVLSAGCATGEEAYTIAILMLDSGLFEGWDVEVLGCDISRRCLAVARSGAYGEHAFRTPEAESLRRWFRLRAGKWVVDEVVRRMVRFAGANLLDERGLAGTGPFDAVFFRNVMIYFDQQARRLVLRRLHDRLHPGGWLMLGHSESLLHVTADFELVHLREDLVYRRPVAGEGAP
jgi:chemotaxis protein methyltransferase CheR